VQIGERHKRAREEESPILLPPPPLLPPKILPAGSKGWSAAEERALIEAASEASCIQGSSQLDWRSISDLVSGKTPKQCKEKWTNSLRPGLCFDRWTLQEQYALVLGHTALGTKWQSISERFLPHRSENGIKNHW
jgi:hypothetical protein